jgi:hypothetical protein
MRMQLSSLSTPQVGIGTSVFDNSGVALQILGNTTMTGQLILNGLNVDLSSYITLDPNTLRIASNQMPVGTVITSGPSNQIDTSLLPPTFTGSYFKTFKNFGIGTRTPLQRLHVQGGSTYVSDRIGVGNVSNAQPLARLHAVESSATIPTALLYNTVGGDIMHTYMSSNSSIVPVMCVVGTNSGGVGICTDIVHPQNALEVVGNISATSLNIQSISLSNSLVCTNIQQFNLATNNNTLLQLNFDASSNASLSSGVPVNINNNLTVQNTLTVNGDISLFSSPAIFSDIRMKRDVQPILNPIDKLSGITGCTYTMICDHDNSRHAGVIAQDVLSVFPEAVSTAPNGFLSVRYNSLIPLLIESIKELQARVRELEKANISASSLPS